MNKPLTKVDLDPSVTSSGLGRVVDAYGMGRAQTPNIDARRIDAMPFQPPAGFPRAIHR
jgi:hypothetical protein